MHDLRLQLPHVTAISMNKFGDMAILQLNSNLHIEAFYKL
jgi:hypothetical protein